jgi:UDP-galactopyranose mutase
MTKPNRFLIIGAGFSGAVLARRLVELFPECHCEVWDERLHVAGNCHTSRDEKTGVMVHRYGPHIFNTDNDRVWEFVNRFGEFRPFVNRVKAQTVRGIFSLPINLHTINQFFGLCLSPAEAEKFLAQRADNSIETPANFEEQALKMIGRDLYEAFFKGYTIKQWGCDPKLLPASILQRLPVRFNYNDCYYEKKYQAIPADGYTEVVNRMLDHPHISVLLGKPFSGLEDKSLDRDLQHLFYTGPLDAFFHFSLGRLSYRTVTFERIDTSVADFQGNAVMNYPDISVPWTRIHEHKHFAPWENHEQTVAWKEFSQETQPGDPPYYPKRLAPDKKLLAKYRAEAARLNESPRKPKVTFLGRLATYRYLDMEKVIAEALELAEEFQRAWSNRQALPVFPNTEQDSWG